MIAELNAMIEAEEKQKQLDAQKQLFGPVADIQTTESSMTG